MAPGVSYWTLPAPRVALYSGGSAITPPPSQGGEGRAFQTSRSIWKSWVGTPPLLPLFLSLFPSEPFSRKLPPCDEQSIPPTSQGEEKGPSCPFPPVMVLSAWEGVDGCPLC